MSLQGVNLIRKINLITKKALSSSLNFITQLFIIRFILTRSTAWLPFCQGVSTSFKITAEL